jgi:hypothetical protein
MTDQELKELVASMISSGYEGKKLYGILAAVDAPEAVRKKVLQEGIYLARVHDGHFELQVPKDFQPHAF